MKQHSYKTLLAGLALLGNAALANGSAIYSDFIHEGAETVDYRVEIGHDQSAGLFDVSYQVTNNASVKKFTGFFFDLSSDYNADNLGLTNQFNSSGQTVCATGFGVANSAGSGGCKSNLNEGTFDVGLVWSGVDLSSAPYEGGFSISDLGHLTLEDWGAIGMRAQAVNGEGSAKEVQWSADTGPSFDMSDAVPASSPGTIALLGLSFAGLLVSRKRFGKNLA